MRRWQAQQTRIMLLVSLRTAATQVPDPVHQSGLISWLTDAEHEWSVCHLELGPLDQLETVHMLRGLLEPPAPDFAQWVYSETRGHPFYFMETLKDLLERGALHPHRRAQGKWSFELDSRHDLGKSVRVPSTVRVVIRSRLNRLSPAAFSLLAAGTVLEHALTFERLCAVANLPPDVGLSALDELLSSRLLRDIEMPGLASAFAFANDMLRDVVYTEAGDSRRRLFHRRALDLLEAEHDSAAVLAHHALAAGEAQDALRHSLAAGQEALRVVATSEAHAHLERARQLARGASAAGADVEARLHDLYTQLGQTYEQNDQPDQAARIYAERARIVPPRPRADP
jgi:predicted ATPase